jgi:DNA adenine methylase
MRTGPKGEGYKIQLVHRLPQIQERLKNVKLVNKDWREVVKQFDSSQAFFYLDPPYPNHWPDDGRDQKGKFFKEEDMLKALHKIKGQFMLSYELEKAKLFKGFKTYRIKTVWTGANQLGFRKKYELLVSNFPIKETNLYLED